MIKKTSLNEIIKTLDSEKIIVKGKKKKFFQDFQRLMKLIKIQYLFVNIKTREGKNC